MQKQQFYHVQKQENLLDLNDSFDYFQPFKTPLVIYGKLITENNLSIIGFSYGKQRNVFWGDYMKDIDKLIIKNGCKNTNTAKIMNDIIKKRTEDNYILLCTTSRNKITSDDGLLRSFIKKTSFMFLNYEHLNIYLDLLYQRSGLIKTDDNEIQMISLLNTCILYGLSLYFIYNDEKIPQETLLMFPSIKNNIRVNMVKQILLDYNKDKIIETVNKLNEDLNNISDFYHMENIGNIDINLLTTLNIAININKDYNLSDVKNYISLTKLIINHLSKRSFINNDIKTPCPELEYCEDNYMNEDLCEMYTNFIL